MSHPSDAPGPPLRLVLVDESLWSRGLFRLPPIARADLLAHLGRQLTETHSDILEDPVPDPLGVVIGRASEEGGSPLPEGEPGPGQDPDRRAAEAPASPAAGPQAPGATASRSGPR